MEKRDKTTGVVAGLAALLIIMTIISCKKSSDENPADGNVSGHYELMMPGGANGEPEKFYQMTFSQKGSIVTGDIALNDSGTLVNGAIAGTLTNGVFIFHANMDNSEHTFHFRATVGSAVKPAVISGKFVRNAALRSGDSTGANLMGIGDWHCVPNYNVNAHVFRQVSSAPNPTGPPVIFIHGMDGSMTNWDTIVLNLSADFKARHNVYEYQYNWKDSIIINGRQLKHDVDSAGFSQPPILIGHSMGGLVSRGYVVSGGAITKLVTLGTPHLGTPLVNLINFVCIANYPGPRNMYPSDGYIQYILHHPLDSANRSKYYAIAGRMGGKWVLSWGSLTWTWNESYYAAVDKLGFDLFRTLFPLDENDGLVNLNSAQFHNGNVNRPLSIQDWVDHFNLIKPLRAPEVMDYINSL